MVAMCILSACSCEDDIVDGNNFNESHFGIKSATIVYTTENLIIVGDNPNSYVTLIFDDYGKKLRLEAKDEVYIADESSGFCYALNTTEKTYTTDISNSMVSMRYWFLYYGDDKGFKWQTKPGYKKEKNVSIAGKNCSVCKYDDGDLYEWGGWKRITFVWSIDDGTSNPAKFTAQSITESVPANSFVVPSDYTKEK